MGDSEKAPTVALTKRGLLSASPHPPRSQVLTFSWFSPRWSPLLRASAVNLWLLTNENLVSRELLLYIQARSAFRRELLKADSRSPIANGY
ncbi:hypothetical protein SBA4_4730002 [Candidatus Sulfopaludibacter sp. SbA4]|nr:hypothetical protein SBA4_4730002 [Candidatus Sulfopaludibacter sp. SbA4]